MTLALSTEEFESLITACGPFEDQPLVAVGVSGGADSLALTLLADHWARARGGTVVGLTVDHGLRPESAAEAERTSCWLSARAIAHKTLTIDGAVPPRRGIQAWARERRLHALASWARSAGCLHVLLAHHQEDQAETVLLRMARGGGASGLAAMAPIEHRDWWRLLRPLLGVPAAALRATLKARGQPWIDDPSNSDPAFARVRMRALAPALAAEGLTAERLHVTAQNLSRARVAIEAEADHLLANAFDLYPEGWGVLRPHALRAGSEEAGLRALSWLTSSLGGRTHGPRFNKLALVWERLEQSWTLGGCHAHPTGQGALLTRESRGLPLAQTGLSPLERWDRRFHVSGIAHGMTIAPLAAASAREWRLATVGSLVPRLALATTPALFDTRGLAAAPAARYIRSGIKIAVRAIFAPNRPIGGARARTSLAFDARAPTLDTTDTTDTTVYGG